MGKGERGDLRIRRKKEQGREAGRYYEQCANRVREFPSVVPTSVSLSLSPSLHPCFSPRFSLHSLSYSCLLFNGPRRCSLIDGTDHGRTARRRGRRKEETEGRKKRNRETDVGGRMSGRRAALLDHHRLIYNAGDNRIHDQNPAFRGIDGSPCAARRRDDSGIFK